MERRWRANNHQSRPIFYDIEQDYGDLIMPEEESRCYQYHPPAPQLDPTDRGTYLMNAVKVS